MDGEDLDDGLDELAEENEELYEGMEKNPRKERGRNIDIQFLREIMYGLESVSMGTHQLLYFSAMKYAKNHLETDAEDVEEAVKELAERFDRMNIGSINFDQDSSPLTVELEDNAVSYGAPDTGRKMDYFIAGYISGYLENCLDSHYVVNEVECSAEGEESCVFEIKER